jgi:hypothetical protein
VQRFIIAACGEPRCSTVAVREQGQGHVPRPFLCASVNDRLVDLHGCLPTCPGGFACTARADEGCVLQPARFAFGAKVRELTPKTFGRSGTLRSTRNRHNVDRIGGGFSLTGADRLQV